MAASVDHSTTAQGKSAAPHMVDLEQTAPIVVDLGKKSRKQIRQARKGNGKLMDELNGVVEELRASGTLKPTAQPILVIVRQKRRKSNMLWPMA